MLICLNNEWRKLFTGTTTFSFAIFSPLSFRILHCIFKAILSSSMYWSWLPLILKVMGLVWSVSEVMGKYSVIFVPRSKIEGWGTKHVRFLTSKPVYFGVHCAYVCGNKSRFTRRFLFRGTVIAVGLQVVLLFFVVLLFYLPALWTPVHSGVQVVFLVRLCCRLVFFCIFFVFFFLSITRLVHFGGTAALILDLRLRLRPDPF